MRIRAKPPFPVLPADGFTAAAPTAGEFVGRQIRVIVLFGDALFGGVFKHCPDPQLTRAAQRKCETLKRNHLKA